MNYLQAIILAIVEGLTEFLPVSSTGHMIIASSVMGIASEQFTKHFTVMIQFGAILSVVVLYFKRFLKSISFYYLLFVSFLPAAILGFLMNDYIESLLENVWVVAANLLAGGVFLLFIDRIFKRNDTFADSTPNYKTGFLIGLFQVIAMIPGVSRSAATIVGGLTMGLNRKSAAEFSFFLAVPTMFGATIYKLYKILFKEGGFTGDQIPVLILGNIVAFIVAMLAIRFFIGYLTKHGFKVFGWYRIALGLTLLALLAAGYDLTIV